MADFITLTSRDTGKRQRINADHIVRIIDMGTYALIVTSETDCPDGMAVDETPEQIDALLGVTADPVREEARWYRYDSMGYATAHWTTNINGYVLIPEGQTVPAGWWRYEATDCDESGKFDRLHRAAAGGAK